ncbi:hypothetical protein QBC43DRAFT_332107 [Cladorrhinum sp. PSN259]|nr:hypothetical protein QBC43DRAFT_332107 [Cladorrhinum sp. PSN259]
MSANGDIPFPISTNATTPPPELLPPGIIINERAAYLAQVFIVVTSILTALCTITFCTRIYQRIFPVWKVGLDDYFIVVGFALAIADWALLFPLMVPQPGLISFERGMNAGKHSWLAIPIWGLSMTCIKISIALTLLRIRGSERGWRIFLYTIMGVQAIYGVGNTVFDLAIACRPLSAAWDVFTPGGKCVSVEVMRAVSNLGSSINITTDVLLSLAPATFLRKLNRPLRERVFVCVLMGMGLFASVSSIMKTVIIKDWGDPTAEDWWAMGVSICTWTALEQLLGVLAACVPAMKSIFQRCLGKVGVSLTESRSQRAGYYPRNRGTGVSGGGGIRSGVARDEVMSGTFESLASADVARRAQRFSRAGKDDIMVEYDEEVGIDLPEMTRKTSTVKSAGSIGSLSHVGGHSRQDSEEKSNLQVDGHGMRVCLNHPSKLSPIFCRRCSEAGYLVKDEALAAEDPVISQKRESGRISWDLCRLGKELVDDDDSLTALAGSINPSAQAGLFSSAVNLGSAEDAQVLVNQVNDLRYPGVRVRVPFPPSRWCGSAQRTTVDDEHMTTS